jgi:hypothetical protein
MDNQRPQLDLKFYEGICADRNGAPLRTFVIVFNTTHFEVPVIAVFTKYDQFLRNVGMDLADFPDQDSDGNASEVAEKRFREHYLQPLGDDVRYVRLESGFRVISQCYRADVLRQKCICKIGAAMTLSRQLLQH